MSKNKQNGGKDAGTNSFEKIYEVVRQIPPGKVATYGQIAAFAGNRLVKNAEPF